MTMEVDEAIVEKFAFVISTVFTRFGMLDSGYNIQLATYAFAIMT